MNNVIVYSTRASGYFAEKIARTLGAPTGKIESKEFRNGETYHRIDMQERTKLFGKDVVFVGSTHTDADIEELYRLGCAFAMYGARRRIFAIPFLGYSTMERSVLPGEIVTAKTLARKLSSIPNSGMGNTFLFMDLHVAGLVHYFEGECLRFELYGQDILDEQFGAIPGNPPENLVFGSADLGRPAWVNAFSKRYGTKLVLINKRREGEHSEVHDVIGSVEDAHVVIYDDMLRSGDSFVHAAHAYLEHGAKEVSGIVSHLALNNEGVVDFIDRSPITRIITTNTHPISQCDAVRRSPKFIVGDASGVFAKHIFELLA